MKDELKKQKTLKSTKNKNVILKISIIFVILMISVLSVIFCLSFFNNDKKMDICGDGTFYDTCSINKPYYCESGILKEKSSLCGCEENFYKLNESCAHEIYGKGTEKVFNYVLRGEENQIIFTVYQNISQYLEDLPRFKTYEDEEIPLRGDFKFLKINDPIQKAAIRPLIVSIQNLAPNSLEDQVRIAVSLVQNINYGESEIRKILGYEIKIPLYPYQVLIESTGSCESKSELLVLILKELNYGSSFLYYPQQNHEAVGIKCPIKNSIHNSGYCFIETTMPAPISYSNGKYLGLENKKLNTVPQIIVISQGRELGKNLYEYADSRTLSRILNIKNPDRGLNFFQNKILNNLRKKYGLNY